MPDILRYVDLTLEDLRGLDREKTIFLLCVSPIEVHGPHLPVGTDMMVAEELQRRYAKELSERHPQYQVVVLPHLYVGSDALPVAGSLSVRALALEAVLTDYAKGLARQGFKYLFISDNHGGPRHQMALYRASKAAWRKWKFYVVCPFNAVFRDMVQHNPEFLERCQLTPGTCGDDSDSHAGTNETSLVLAIDETRAGKYEEVPPSVQPQSKGAVRIVALLGQLISNLNRQWGADLLHLAATLAWVSDPEMKPYMGNPQKARKNSGEMMLTARVQIAMDLFERALSGEPVDVKPMLHWLSFLRRLPE